MDGPADIVCTGASSIAESKEGDITYIVSAKYARCWADCDATIGIVQKKIDVQGHDASSRTLLRVDSPELAMAKILELFKTSVDLPAEGIHESVVIDSSATIGSKVRIGPNVVIAANAVIGDGVIFCSNVRIGSGCTIGSNTTLRSGVVIEHDCVVGDDCLFHPNVTIGADGFGFCPASDFSSLVKLQHVGNVEIGNCVEIGANSCVDRGKFSATKIGNGTKLDNLVQIGHNCTIGENCVFAATTAIGGSVQIGNWVQIAANVGIAPHCKVGDGAKIGAKSGVMHDIPAGEEWLGLPAGKMSEVLRQWASTRKLPGIIAQFGRSTDQ